MNPNQSVKLFQLSFESGKPIWYNSKQAYLLLPLFFFFGTKERQKEHLCLTENKQSRKLKTVSD